MSDADLCNRLPRELIAEAQEWAWECQQRADAEGNPYVDTSREWHAQQAQKRAARRADSQLWNWWQAGVITLAEWTEASDTLDGMYPGWRLW